MNCEKGGRRNQFLDQWLKEFGWLQTRGSGDDLLMICTVIVENREALCLIDVDYALPFISFCQKLITH